MHRMLIASLSIPPPVNNALYLQFFDSVINHALIARGALDIRDGHPDAVVGLCVSSSCEYRAAVEYPHVVMAAMRVSSIGRTSVVYEAAVFNDGMLGQEPSDGAAALGSFVHVFVRRDTRKPTPISGRLLEVLEELRGDRAAVCE